jgi:hypothetical protein
MGGEKLTSSPRLVKNSQTNLRRPRGVVRSTSSSSDMVAVAECVDLVGVATVGGIFYQWYRITKNSIGVYIQQ